MQTDSVFDPENSAFQKSMAYFWGIVVFALLAFVHHQDFIEARMEECAQQQLAYNPDTDQCQHPEEK